MADVQRNPITREAVVNDPSILPAEVAAKVARAGIRSPGVRVGRADPLRGAMAKRALVGFSQRGSRTAGMLIPQTGSPGSGPFLTGYTDDYFGSYAKGNRGTGAGTYDIPTYFVMMNEQNGGVLYWPQTLREKYSWYRYFARCFFLGSFEANVLMFDGTEKPLQDVREGDLVVTAKGTIKPVKWTYKKLCEDESVIVDAVGCDKVQVTHHHPFYVLRREQVYRYYYERETRSDGKRRKNIEFKPEWVHAENLRAGDHILRPMGVDFGQSMVEINGEAKFLGLYCADGNLIDNTGAYQIQIACHAREVEWDTSVFSAVLPEDRDVHPHQVSGNGWHLKASSKALFALCDEHVGRGSRTKCLSQDIMALPRPKALEFLGGYFSGDGYRCLGGFTNRGELKAVTTSPALASQVPALCLKHGVVCRKRKVREDGEDGQAAIWHLTVPRKFAGAIRQASKWDGPSYEAQFETGGGSFVIGGYLASKVRSVERKTEKDFVYNLEIDAPGTDENSFVCNGMVVHNTDSYVGRSLELLADLPMSKVSLHMPRMEKKSKKLKQEIFDFFTYMCERIGLYQTLQDVLWEVNVIGNWFGFHEWDEKLKMWSRVVTLPPEEVSVFQYPFSDQKRVEYKPERLIALIKSTEGHAQNPYVQSDGVTKQILKHIPKEIVRMVRKEGCIVMDTDPTTGSFVHHIARRRAPYLDLGASVLERVLVPMLQKENYRYTQLSLASRNMTPKNLIAAPGLTPDELDELRAQVDLSYMDPDYSIVTNYEVTWEQLGADARLLDLSTEYERIESQVFAGLGTTRELLTGEGAFTGNKITVEILNTMFLLVRNQLQNYVERQLFQPVAEAHGWYDENKRTGIKTYYYPRLGFNRLTIRDNAEVFDSLFQLYQKGSLPVDVIYELFNLDSDDLHDRIYADLFTVKDPNFNRTVEEISGEAGRNLVENSDVVKKIAKYLKLELPAGGGGEEGGGFGGGEFGGGGFGGGGFGGDGFDAAPEPEPEAKQPEEESGAETGPTPEPSPTPEDEVVEDQEESGPDGVSEL